MALTRVELGIKILDILDSNNKPHSEADLYRPIDIEIQPGTLLLLAVFIEGLVQESSK